MKFSQERREYERRIKALRSAIQAEIKNLPDNPKIARLAPNCFVIRSSDLGNNWTPEHHDWIKQYELASKLLDNDDFRSGVKNFIRVIRSGKLRIGPSYTVYFAKQVRHNLKHLYVTIK